MEPEKGRFRTFLKMALKRFLVREWERLRTAKRGGDRTHLSFDTTEGEARFQQDPVASLAPECIYLFASVFRLNMKRNGSHDFSSPAVPLVSAVCRLSSSSI